MLRGKGRASHHLLGFPASLFNEMALNELTKAGSCEELLTADQNLGRREKNTARSEVEAAHLSSDCTQEARRKRGMEG